MEDLSKVIKITVSDSHNGMLLEKMIPEDHTGFFSLYFSFCNYLESNNWTVKLKCRKLI